MFSISKHKYKTLQKIQETGFIKPIQIGAEKYLRGIESYGMVYDGMSQYRYFDTAPPRASNSWQISGHMQDCG